MILNALRYYREKLELSNDDFPSREPGLLLHHEHYLEGKKAYERKDWQESADHMEAALSQYKDTLYNCLTLCDDVLLLNMTHQSIDMKTNNLLDELKLIPNSMEYYTLLQNVIQTYLTCQTRCHSWMATVNGKHFDKYLAGHFHYLQYNYFKSKAIIYLLSAYSNNYTVSLLNKAAEAASTYQVLEPSDDVMARNIRVFRGEMNVLPEHFKPRKVIESKY